MRDGALILCDMGMKFTATSLSHSAGIVPLLAPSAGSMMNAVLFTALGAGAHPALLLLHDLLGSVQNLDLAYAARLARHVPLRRQSK